jgi:hypothetical protein
MRGLVDMSAENLPEVTWAPPTQVAWPAARGFRAVHSWRTQDVRTGERGGHRG